MVIGEVFSEKKVGFPQTFHTESDLFGTEEKKPKKNSIEVIVVN